MRERFIVVLVGMTLAVIALYGVPRAYYIADMVEQQETGELDRTATFLATLIGLQEDAGGDVDAELLGSQLEESDAASYVDASGRRVTAGNLDTDPESAIVEERELAGGGELVVTRDRDVVSERVQEALLPLVLLGIALSAVAAAVAFVLAGRVTGTFRKLAEAARELGHGRFEVDVPRTGIPEAVAIGSALEESGARLDELVRREREFAVNASHQLRTPVTALRLELEDLTYWEQTDPEVAAQINRSIRELDRLAAVIDDLLDLARSRRKGENQRVDLAAFVADAAQRWRSRVDADGRRLELMSEGPVAASIPTGPVGQILDVLIENARLHGSGTITVAARDEPSIVAVRVSDEGARRFGNEVFRRGVSSRLTDGAGTGVGLAVASELAEAVGGHLAIDESAPTTTFELLLPAGNGDRAAVS